jgi:hypothetical protein
MRKVLIPWFFAVLLLMGCSTTYYVPRDPGAGEFVEAMGKMEGSTAVVYSIEGSEFSLDRLTVRSDSLVGYDPDNNVEVVLPLSKVDEIALTSVVRGAGRGAVRGIAIGGGIGLLLGAAFGNDMVFGAVAGAFYGAITGVIAGAFTLSNDNYRMVAKGDSRITGKWTSEEMAPSQMITLKSWPLKEETP